MLPVPGTKLDAGDELATIDSQKAEIAVQAPAALEVLDANDALVRDPMLVRMEPLGRGWLVVAALEAGSWERLLTLADYEEALRVESGGAATSAAPQDSSGFAPGQEGSAGRGLLAAARTLPPFTGPDWRAQSPNATQAPAGAAMDSRRYLGCLDQPAVGPLDQEWARCRREASSTSSSRRSQRSRDAPTG